MNYDIVFSILKDKLSIVLFENISKETCIQIYDFIIKHKMHIRDHKILSNRNKTQYLRFHHKLR